MIVYLFEEGIILKKVITSIVILAIFILLSGCEDLTLPNVYTSGSEKDEINETDNNISNNAISETEASLDDNQNEEQNDESSEEVIGHWEFVEKILSEPEDYISDKMTVKSFIFNNSATCDSTAIQTATGKKEIEKISTKTHWSDPDFYYLPDDLVYLQLSAEVSNFERPPGGTNFGLVEIWSYIGGEKSGYLSPSSSNMQTSDGKKSAKAVINNGEISVDSNDIEVSGKMGPGKDGDRRVIHIRNYLHHSSGLSSIKYIYEYKTGVLPEYDSLENSDSTETENAMVEESEESKENLEEKQDDGNEGYWKLVSFKQHNIQNQDDMVKSSVDNSSDMNNIDLFKILATSDGGKAYILECRWSKLESTYLPDEEVSIKLEASIKGNSGIMIDEFLNDIDVESFYELVNIWSIFDSKESGYTSSFCTDKITIFSESETEVKGTFGKGEEGDIKIIEIRYAFPTLGGIDYIYQYEKK